MVFAGAGTVSAAVKIGGKVVDAANGKPIDNALCSIRRGKGAPVAYTFTDREGRRAGVGCRHKRHYQALSRRLCVKGDCGQGTTHT